VHVGAPMCTDLPALHPPAVLCPMPDIPAIDNDRREEVGEGLALPMHLPSSFARLNIAVNG
jgi:hypothetical protein